jgi:hypothetical protein
LKSIWGEIGLSFTKLFFAEIGTLVTWLKSTLLLKIKCFDSHINIKYHNVYKHIKTLIKENASVAGGVRYRVGVN